MTVQSCAGEKSATLPKPQLNKTTENTQRTLLCRGERSWDGRWGFVQDSTKKLSDFTVCKALSYIMKKIKTSLQAPETPCCQTSSFHAGTTVPAQTFSLWGTGWLLQHYRTQSQQGVFKKYDIRRASWTQLGISCNSATLRLPTVPGFVEIFTILILLFYSEKARNILVKDLTSTVQKPTHK